MRVRRHAPTGIAPPRRPHARTEACSNRGSTYTKVFIRVRRLAPTGVAPKRRFSFMYAGVLQQG